VCVSAIKQAEDDDALIVRLVETHGGEGPVELTWNLPISDVRPTDLLERPVTLAEFRHDPARQRTTILLRPFQIVTLAARRL